MAELAPEISPKIAAIIDKALEFEPEARWDDAPSMQAAVRAVLTAFVRDPTLLAKPAPVKPAWPPPPVLPGPPMAPRLSVPELPQAEFAPESGMRLPASAGGLRKATPFAGSSSPTKVEVTPSAEPAPPPSSSPPPPPLHLQVEARSLEAGSPLLETNRKRRRWGVVGFVLLLAAGSFGAAYAIQNSPELRVTLGIDPAPVAPLAPSSDEPAAPAPSAVSAIAASADAPLEVDDEATADAGLESMADAAAHAVAQKPKVAPKPKAPVKKPPKKKKRRW